MSGPALPFRDPATARRLLRALHELPRPPRTLTFMHVCGTHEQALARFGLRRALPGWLRLLAGPGCPVCVCPPREIARAARIALAAGATVATFGDMLRVPGEMSLEEARGRGGDLRVVMGAAEAVELARRAPQRETVFFAVGFETTACTTAAALLADPPSNFSVLCAHRIIPPALRALLELKVLAVDGFLLPGHAAAVSGTEVYEAALRGCGRPSAVAGFEPVDILLGLTELLRQCRADESGVSNCYPRVVRAAGNPRARAMMEQVFETVDAEWRGLGRLPASGCELRPAFAAHDARRRFVAVLADLNAGAGPQDMEGCRCGEVMTGLDPVDCPLFGAACTPETPRGACMVGSEGTCRARFVFGEG